MLKSEIKILGIPVFSRTISESEKRSAGYSLQHPSDAFLSALGVKSKSGATVNDQTALTLSAVWACVRILSNTVAMPPLGVYRKSSDGSRQPDQTHPVHRLIHDEPNDIHGSFQWRQVMQAHAALKGNAYSIIHRNGSNRPAELELIENPAIVDPFVYKRKMYYRVQGYAKVFPSDDIFHIRGLSFDGIKGKSILQVARETMGGALAQEEYGNKIYSSGGSQRVALVTPGTLKSETKSNMRDSWENIYGGVENSHKAAILEGGVDVKNIGINPEDAQFILSRRFSVEEIARFFGIVLDLLSTDNKQTYASVEQRAIDFIKYTMMPWYTTWESEINRKLFRENEKGKYYSKFKLDALLRGDTKARADFYKDMFYIGAFNRNEIRRLEDMNSIEDGDDYYLQVNLDKAENIGNNQNPQNNE